MLYKQNLMGKKTEYERGEIASMLNERVTAVEDLTTTNFKEVSTFLHEIHADLESYIDKHKKEHANLDVKVQKSNEDLTNVIVDLKGQQRFSDLLGTVLTIISESSSIEHALADQDEDDRARM